MIFPEDAGAHVKLICIECCMMRIYAHFLITNCFHKIKTKTSVSRLSNLVTWYISMLFYVFALGFSTHMIHVFSISPNFVK